MIGDDEQIKKDVVEQLYWDDRVDASGINVTVADRKVELNGTVPSSSARTAAWNDAIVIPGVASVENNLAVAYPEHLPRVEDAEIKARVYSIFEWDAEIDPAEITVDAVEGEVTLDGSVDSYWKRRKAEVIAAGIRGVTRVINNLAVTPTEAVTDKLIAEDIAASLARALENVSRYVNVEVKDGTVTLSGIAPDRHQYRTMLAIASYTPGVTGVIDNLSIA